MSDYSDLNFKIPVESKDYSEASDFVIKSIESILADAIQKGENKIVINTNLRKGLPMENINKIAGPKKRTFSDWLALATQNGWIK